MKVNYTLFMVLVTPLAVLLVAVGDPGNWKVADERVLETLIGVALALVGGYLLWPSWERRRLPDQLAGTVDADRAYLKVALTTLAGSDGQPSGAERARAERENANAAASLQRLRSEPARERGDPQPVDAGEPRPAPGRRRHGAGDRAAGAVAGRANAPTRSSATSRPRTATRASCWCAVSSRRSRSTSRACTPPSGA